jgi:4-methylaminobutanoate oxidase (formaldehyde-forming)
MSNNLLPERAHVVVVGGGIIGCSVIYHLAKMGWKDVVWLHIGNFNRTS